MSEHKWNPFKHKSKKEETPTQPNIPKPTTLINAVYYPNWRVYRSQPPSSLNLDFITHIYYAFARVNNDGTLHFTDQYADTEIDINGVKGCISDLRYIKNRYPKLKTLLSLGGGGEGSATFPAVACNGNIRGSFARNARQMLEMYGLDGVDVDWEHPSDPSQGHYYVQLLAALREELPAPRYLLTSALPAGEWALRNIDLGKASIYLDYINLMTYDFSGPWTQVCGHHSQLHTPRNPHNDAAKTSGDSAVTYLISKGVAPQLILLGIPAYGRSFLGATGVGSQYQGHGGEEGTFEYRDLPRTGATVKYDDEAKAVYCVGGDAGFVTYDDATIVRAKAMYARQKGLGGLFYWTGTGDTNAAHSLVANYNPIEHLNAIFSHPSSLSSATKTSRALRTYQRDLDHEISAHVQQQSSSDVDSVKRIQAAKVDLAELFQKVEGVRQRAIETEEAITEMTADIKRLDNTKKNLTLSMTALKRLQMLTTAYEQLKVLSGMRQYRDCAQLLQAVIQLMAHFKSYRSIDQIATLSRNVADLQREMLEQVCEDFETRFAKGEIGQRRGMLAEACLVMDALGDSARSRLTTWYCNNQLREYRHLFRGSEEAGSLDNISRRYSWFKRMLKTYDDEHAAIFPLSWRVNELLANAFCESTREDFKGILQKSIRRADGQTLDVDLLLSCLQETLDFEHSLERRFTNASRASTDTLNSNDEKMPIFSQAISEAFEPYLSIWVEAQDKHLSTMIPKYRAQPPRPDDEEFSSQMVISSSTELFSFYRLTLAQCAKLSTGARLVELTKVFAKYLDQYAQQILLYYVSERPSGQTPSNVPQIEDLVLALNTADYCYTTSTQLEERIRNRIENEYKSNVDLQSQADAFMGIASATVRALVRKVEIDIEPVWREMRNTGWSKMESVGDQSSYVAEMLSKVKARAAEILGMLAKQQYARAFCDNVVELTANAYLANIFQCKPISEMLLDTYVLKKGFEALLTLSSSSNAAPPPSYIKRVSQSMSRLDPILKTLQVRPSPPEALVQAYLIHVADKTDANFRKILELKGIRKQDQAHLVELFQAHRASPGNENLQQASPLLTPLVVGASSTVTGGVHIPTVSLSSAASLSTTHLPGRFDPSTFGSAIMTAARDGVDRFGTPVLGSSVSSTPAESRMASPPPQQRRPMSPDRAGQSQTGNLNENLRNIGKFFKRDIGGFGGRFGAGRGVEEG